MVMLITAYTSHTGMQLAQGKERTHSIAEPGTLYLRAVEMLNDRVAALEAMVWVCIVLNLSDDLQAGSASGMVGNSCSEYLILVDVVSQRSGLVKLVGVHHTAYKLLRESFQCEKNCVRIQLLILAVFGGPHSTILDIIAKLWPIAIPFVKSLGGDASNTLTDLPVMDLIGYYDSISKIILRCCLLLMFPRRKSWSSKASGALGRQASRFRSEIHRSASTRKRKTKTG